MISFWVNRNTRIRVGTVEAFQRTVCYANLHANIGDGGFESYLLLK